ncbi:MAG TPA: hypothetical protein VGE74_07075 [Gemmata sp.]
MEPYFIENGVHRAVAARENGLTTIPAIVCEPGHPPRRIWVPLDSLYSPRRSVSRSDARHNYPALEQAMGTVAGRMRMPPIEVQPLGLRGQPSSVPLAQVAVDA